MIIPNSLTELENRTQVIRKQIYLDLISGIESLIIEYWEPEINKYLNWIFMFDEKTNEYVTYWEAIVKIANQKGN